MAPRSSAPHASVVPLLVLVSGGLATAVEAPGPGREMVLKQVRVPHHYSGPRARCT